MHADITMNESRLLLPQKGVHMPKSFNTTGICIPEKHYMVNLDARLKEIKKLVDNGSYFVINKAHQYGKTTTLRALYCYLQNDYYVILMDFQTFGNADFQTEESFSVAFAHTFSELFEYNDLSQSGNLEEAVDGLNEESEKLTLRILFKNLKHICAIASKPIVLMIDEIGRASCRERL